RMVEVCNAGPGSHALCGARGSRAGRALPPCSAHPPVATRSVTWRSPGRRALRRAGRRAAATPGKTVAYAVAAAGPLVAALAGVGAGRVTMQAPTLAALALVAGCAVEPGGGESGPDGRGPIDPSELSGSCIGEGGELLCGGPSDGTCFCDADCEASGDCCADKQAVCGEGDGPGPVALEVTAGGEHSCAVRPDRTVSCWGEGAGGRTAAPDGPVLEVSAGGAHARGIRADTTAACWGEMSASPPAGSFLAISAGGAHACGRLADQTLACWGEGAAAPPACAFLDVSAGVGISCGRRADTTLACWGAGAPTPPDGSFVDVSAGGGHACARRADLTVACWGEAGNGQASPPAGTFLALSAGHAHTCGIRR